MGTRECRVGAPNPGVKEGSPEGATREQARQGPGAVSPAEEEEGAPHTTTQSGTTSHLIWPRWAKGTLRFPGSFVMATNVIALPH